MKIKITSCSDPLLWYNRKIGCVVQVHRIESDRYWTREDNDYGFLNFVLIKDCQPYKEIK